MSKLELILLGRFECLLPSGTRISLSMRKAEVLLAYLALTPGLRHPRERLINLLWSDRGEEQARNSLRQCLSAIKKSLGDVADMVLQVDRTSVSLIPELVDIDVHEFERLAAEGDYESLTTAADLYQGEFLEGISIRDAACQEWLDSERSRFKRQFIEILANLAQTQLLSHDYSHAIKSAERLVKQDPLGETGWRLLMRAYFDSGDRNHALQAFKRCQQALRDELDVDPEAATIELRDQIAGGKANPEPEPAPITSKPPVDSSVSTDHSIAVLPFDNLSGDPEQEYFSDGITDSIILNLSLFPGLQVKSRNSSFAFKQQIKNLGEISRELNVDYIVEGSVRRSDQHIRITVQLIDAAEGNQIWGKRYDADLSDLFNLEEELSRAIAATVTGQIESELQRIAIAKGAADQQAYDLLLSGIYHNQRYNQQDTVIAIEKLNQCLAKDPDNVRALMWIYVSHLMDYLGRWTQDYPASFKLAAEHIQKAMALAPESCMVQVFFAQYLVFCGEFDKAAKHLDMALETNPNDPTILTTLALNLEMQGKAEDALKFAERACLLDPYHPWAEWEVAVSQFLSGQYESVLRTISKSRTSPVFIQLFGIASNVKLGRIDIARQALLDFLQKCSEEMLSMPATPGEWLRYTRENYPFKDPQINQDLIDCLVRAGLKDELSSRQAIPESTVHSIAVLPFDNLSGDPAQEYFSDGITESIILNLSLFPGLNVKSRNSSFAFKQQIKSPGEISQELEVDYIVEGSIRKTDERVRVTVQLVDPTSGNQVWGKRYDAEIGNLFDLEEELSRSIAATVTGQIESDLQRIAIAKGANNQDAYDLLLAGVYHCHRITREDTVIAVDKLNRCLQLDPDNVRALIMLYTCHLVNYAERWVSDLDGSFNLAKESIERAMSLAPEEAEVQSTYAEYLVFCGKARQAMAYADKALLANKNDPNTITNKAFVLEMLGQHEQALELAELAQRLDPYHPWVDWNLTECQIFSGQYENALETISNSNNDPELLRVYSIVANIKLGRQEAAQQTLQELLQDCRNSMLTMPATLDDWLQFLKNYIPFEDSSLNDEILECMVQAGLRDETTATPARSQSDGHSIAVLPFDNLSGDPTQEYFSDGITESIILNLSLFPGLNVKSRNSSFAFKQQIKSPGEISKELEVDYIVEGSIRKTDERIRVTVQLVEAASGNQVWGKRYDAEIEDLFDLEEELSRTIATTVTGQIESDLQRIAITKGAAHQQAYDLLLAGKHHANKGNAQETLTAIDKLNQCLALDPDNALAHTELFWCHDINVIDRWVEDIEDARKLADEHIHKAFALAPDLSQVKVAYADYLAYRYRYEEADRQLQQALEKNPNDAEAIAMQAVNLSLQGKAEAALEKAELALRLDPYHSWVRWIQAESLYFSGRYEDCLATIAGTGNAPAFIQIYNIAANIKLERLENAQKALTAFLQFCRQNMLSMPKTIPQWLDYYRDNAPFADPALNQDIIDYLLQAGLEEEMAAAQKSADPEALPSIAVLPFENMSGDPEQEYFSDGITAGIILSLGMFKGLSVKSQRSSFAFKNSVQSSSEIGEALGVDYLVEGSIRKSDSKVRISAQLVEAADGNQVWGRQYNAEAEDVLKLEQELSQTIAATISGRIGHKLQQSAVRKPARDLKSYDLYLRGLYHFGKFTPQDLAIAVDQFERCIEIDPDHAEAHMQLGMVHEIYGYENWTEDREETTRLSEFHLRKAAALEPDNAWIHAYLAEGLLTQDLDQAEYHADKAIELNPNASEAYAAKTQVTMLSRRYDEALECARLCVQLDPYSSGAAWAAGEAYLVCEEYEKSVKTFRSIETPPNVVRAQIAAALAGTGQMELARKEMQLFLENARRNMPGFPSSIAAWRQFWREYLPFKFNEDSEKYIDLLLKAGLCDEMTESGTDIPSIAVLPFENMSGDSEQEFFSDGITTDIISTLSKFDHMRVVARHSTMQYKNQTASIAEIAEQQKVRYILEGSVRKSGDRIRVNAELIDSQTEQVCWSEHYDRDLEDLFVTQDEMTKNIALAMKVHLDDGDMALHRSSGTANIKAWQLTLVAIDLQDTYIRENILEARVMANEAIKLDPNYPYAWVSLGWTHWQEVYAGWCESLEDSLAEAEKAQQRALKLAPEYSEAWSLGGLIHLMKHESEAALAACRKAVELEPGNAEIQALMAFCLIYVGDYENARLHEHKMLKLCPVLPNWYYLLGGEIAQIQGDYDTALRRYQQGIDIEPESPLCRFYLIDVLMEMGDESGARRLAEEIRALDSKVVGRGFVRTLSQEQSLRDRFRANLEKFDLY